MSYQFTKSAIDSLTKALANVDKGVSRILVKVAPDQEGVDSLFFRVVLKDDQTTVAHSRKLGQRTQRIAAELRRRVAELDPGFPYVTFVLESELPRHKRKTA